MNSNKKWKNINELTDLCLGKNNSKATGCEEHILLSKTAAEEGIVLLKNENNLLPLKQGCKVAIFGKAQIDYVKVGGGSGFVHSAYTKNIYAGLKEKSGIEVFDELSAYYEAYVKEAYEAGKKQGMFDETTISEELLSKAKDFTDTAIITICRYSAEGEDRRSDGTDSYFTLSDAEKNMVKTVTDNFKNVIVLLNVGAMIDTSWFATNEKISAALMIWQGGMEGGTATANVLVGEVTPSGKLVDTCAKDFSDYPSSEGFHESRDYVKYTEDIFVGYRYFETIPGKKDRVIYPFGYGLSYTKFELSEMSAYEKNGEIFVSVNVKNTGAFSGKEVVQIYYSAPSGKITKPALELAAFVKTNLLAPGEMQTIVAKFAVNDMASYDDIGDVCKSAWVLEKGEYKIFAGTSVRDITELSFKFVIPENIVTAKLTEYCTPEKLDKRLLATGEYAPVQTGKVERKNFKTNYHNEYKESADNKNLIDVYNGEISLDDFISGLTDEELVNLLKGKAGRGLANTDGMGENEKHGVPAPMTADGPAGVRLLGSCPIKTTAFPVATMLACTWNTEILEKIGAAGALEAKECNLPIWLTPALNIHRSPLCGRNFEYYSEDPLVAGKMAAAMVRGIQSENIVATPKHFACNNKETNRKESDSILSERALREIYIKGFEICVKESDPKLIMTAYNLINGVRASENVELITGILRDEWGYRGLVTTDWNNTASETTEVLAGNDIRMPSTTKMDLAEGLANNLITRDDIAACVKRLLEMILWIE